MPIPLADTLRRLGLSDYEARIYLALAKRSPAGASWIAEECGLSRSSVYTTLAALTTKGLIGTSYRNNVKQFVLEDVSALDAFVRREHERAAKRVELLGTVESALRSLAAPHALIPDITIFEGQEGLKRIYLSMLRDAPSAETMRILRDEFIWDPAWSFVFGRTWRGQVKRLKMEQAIETRLLVNDSAAERAHAAFYRSRVAHETRYLPKKRSVGEFALYMLSDIVSILSFEERHLVGIRITNHNVAENMRQLFDGLWEGSRPVR